MGVGVLVCPTHISSKGGKYFQGETHDGVDTNPIQRHRLSNTGRSIFEQMFGSKWRSPLPDVDNCVANYWFLTVGARPESPCGGGLSGRTRISPSPPRASYPGKCTPWAALFWPPRPLLRQRSRESPVEESQTLHSRGSSWFYIDCFKNMSLCTGISENACPHGVLKRDVFRLLLCLYP